MRHPNLQLTYQILFRIFALGFAFLLASSLFYLFAHEQWYPFLVAKWHIGDPEFLDLLTIGFFAMAKFVLFFYVLIPALAIRWTVRKLEKSG